MNWKLIFGLFLGLLLSAFLWGGIYELYKAEPKATIAGLVSGFLWLIWAFVKEAMHYEEAVEDPLEHHPVRRRAGDTLDPWDPRLGG